MTTESASVVTAYSGTLGEVAEKLADRITNSE